MPAEAQRRRAQQLEQRQLGEPTARGVPSQPEAEALVAVGEEGGDQPLQRRLSCGSLDNTAIMTLSGPRRKSGTISEAKHGNKCSRK